MKSKLLSITMVLFLFLALGVGGARANNAAFAEPQAPMGNAFTYQGQLSDSAGNPINDTCNFRFILYDDAVGGTQIGPTQDKTSIRVMSGYITVSLDFGSSAFLGDARWMEVAVKCSGDAGYTTLTPRQALTPATYALNADLLDGQHATAFSSTGHTHWGQAWAGSGTGLTLSGSTTGLSASGSTSGVNGQSDSTTGTGVYGYTPATSGVTYGVWGVSDSTNGTGVYGYTPATSGVTYGVWGASDSTNGTGVYGHSQATTGTTHGVIGQSDSTSGTGIYGYTPAITGSTYGVYGKSDSTTGTGLYGYTSATTGNSCGVIGVTDSTSGNGVEGWADNYLAATTAGVYGRSDSSVGFGVAGHAYYGGVGVAAWSYSGNLIEAFSGDYPGGTMEFYIDQAGTVYAHNYVIFTPSSLDGETHATSSIQSTETWLEDFGHSNLVNGIAVITIAPDFAAITNLSVDYMVFVSLEGDCQGVYITNKTPTTFEVHELNGGTSNIPFSYRIDAKPAGSETTRLPVVTIPATVDVERQSNETTQPLTPPQPQEQGQQPGQVQP